MTPGVHDGAHCFASHQSRKQKQVNTEFVHSRSAEIDMRAVSRSCWVKPKNEHFALCGWSEEKLKCTPRALSTLSYFSSQEQLVHCSSLAHFAEWSGKTVIAGALIRATIPKGTARLKSSNKEARSRVIVHFHAYEGYWLWSTNLPNLSVPSCNGLSGCVDLLDINFTRDIPKHCCSP